MTTLSVSIVGAFIWFLLIFGMFYMRQTPRAQIRRRLLTMIEVAENERKKNARSREADKKIQSAQQKADLSHTFYYRIIRPIIKSVVDFFQRLTPASITNMLEMYIFRIGKQGIWSTRRVAALWCLSVMIGVGFAFLLMQYRQFLFMQKVVLAILGGILGATLPFVILSYKIRQRQKMLKRQLPEFLDLLCVSVQAGLSFDGAVAKIVSRMKNTLSDEFRHLLDDVQFGMTKQYALNQMAKRCDIEEIYLFTTSIIQAEKLGTSMAQTLQLQADNMRERHRQYVRAEAMKAPVKMLFPMVIFIFPSIFVVLLLPSLLSLIKTLGK